MSDLLRTLSRENADLWITSLRNDGLPQVAGHLCSLSEGEGLRRGVRSYCCLGVYAKVKGADIYPPGTFLVKASAFDDEGDESDPGYNDETTLILNGDEINSSEMLEDKWAEGEGITSGMQSFLSSLNDGGTITLARDNAEQDWGNAGSDQRAAWRTLFEMYAETISDESEGYTKYHFYKASFADIAAVIDEHFVKQA